VLRDELPSLGEPRAAILVLCLAMVAADAVAEVRAAWEAAHPGEDPASLSGYDLAEEIAEARRAIELFVPDAVWRQVAAWGDAAFAGHCLSLAGGRGGTATGCGAVPPRSRRRVEPAAKNATTTRRID